MRAIQLFKFSSDRDVVVIMEANSPSKGIEAQILAICQGITQEIDHWRSFIAIGPKQKVLFLLVDELGVALKHKKHVLGMAWIGSNRIGLRFHVDVLNTFLV